MWVRNDTAPPKSGYYLTVHLLDGERLLKAFWYSVELSEWVFRYDPEVLTWWDVRYDYYVPCQYQENVDPVPEEMR